MNPEPFVGEIGLAAFNYAPKGWALCNGQLLQIAQNAALFSLLGTRYGGDGVKTFGLPNFQGGTPIHKGGAANHPLGQHGGEPTHTLASAEMPQHTHGLSGSTVPGDKTNPNFGGAGYVLAPDPGNFYSPGFSPGAAALADGSVSKAGNGQAHENMQPYLALNYCIALTGIFPSRN